MAKILVVSGHPDYKHSVANRAILDEFHRLAPHAEIVYLDALYPDWRINIGEEQKRLLEADTIIFEFPMWWFSAPSLMHRYVELVFAHGFAYGSGGTALQGKKLILSFTTGAPKEAYEKNGAEGYAIDELMRPFEATMHFTGLVPGGRAVSFDMAYATNPTDEHKRDIVAKANAHAAQLVKMAS